MRIIISWFYHWNVTARSFYFSPEKHRAKFTRWISKIHPWRTSHFIMVKNKVVNGVISRWYHRSFSKNFFLYSCRKNQRRRANLTILMTSRLYQYTCLLLMNSLEAFKCNWNEFCPKEIFYLTPKCIRVVTKLSIIMLRQWNRNNRKTFMSWFSIADSFHALSKSFVYIILLK